MSFLPTLTRRQALQVCGATLVVSNVASNRVLGIRGYVPWNLAVASFLLLLARRAGHNGAALGLDPRRLRGAARVGASSAAVVALAYALSTATPVGRAALVDERAAGVGYRGLWAATLFRIPLGTVVLEEVAFRGVLPALLRDGAERTWREDLLAALAFGLWHVLPARGLVQANDVVARVGGRAASVVPRVLAVVVSAAGGIAFAALRRAGGHLAAPAAVHLAVNVLGYGIAWWRGRPARRRSGTGPLGE